jgi:hypothetical protein
MTIRNLRSSKKAGRQSQRIRFALALPMRAEIVSIRLQTFDSVLGHFFADENFVTLLGASLAGLDIQQQCIHPSSS